MILYFMYMLASNRLRGRPTRSATWRRRIV
jgi:hypothetical protein